MNVECPITDCDYTATHAEVAVVGDLLSVHATVHATVPWSLDANAKIEKLKRPTVALAGTGVAWSYVITRWGEYNTRTKLIGPDIVAQLLECRDDELRKDLIRTTGKSLTNSDEKYVLVVMNVLAVRSENTMAAQVALSYVRLGHAGPIRLFYARISGHAGRARESTR